MSVSTSAARGKPVWFITGCSTGFGRELARQLLEGGYRAVVTARNPDDLRDFAGNGNALILKLDVTVHSQIDAAVKAAEEKFGRIDVLVNNAGIGYFGSAEESEDEQVRRMFDINVFGLGRMTSAVLPGMRKKRSGSIVNISSLAGIRTFPGLSYYNATKFAVVGFSGALQEEVEPLGIKVIVVEPSGFRTDWAGRSANECPHLIEDYRPTAGAKCEQLRAVSGKQPGDPVRAVRAIINAVESPNPPHHLPLGNAAFELGMVKFETMRKEFAAQEAVARGADSPKE